MTTIKDALEQIRAACDEPLTYGRSNLADKIARIADEALSQLTASPDREKVAANRIWFDTEFIEDGTTIDLISIGMVRADGATYYAETDQWIPGKASQWVKDNVIIHLKGGDCVKPRDVIAREIVAFAGEKPEFWAYYADYDWVALCQLFGTMMQLPDGWPKFCRDIKQRAVDLGNPKLPEPPDVEHHALADALWNKQAWEFLATGLVAGEAAVRADWHTTGWDRARNSGRILLVWSEFAGVREHIELGWYSDSKAAWVNTYGHPFHGEPDGWAPLLPFKTAETIKADEREKCAKVADEFVTGEVTFDDFCDGMSAGAKTVAAAIRSGDVA